MRRFSLRPSPMRRSKTRMAALPCGRGRQSKLSGAHLARFIRAALTCVFLTNPSYGFTQQPDGMQIMRKLASYRLALDRCIEHPGFRKEERITSALFLSTMQVSTRLDRIIDNFHYVSKNRMLYVGYSIALKQLRTLEKSSQKEKAANAPVEIGMVCDVSLFGTIRSELPNLEKQLQPMVVRP